MNIRDGGSSDIIVSANKNQKVSVKLTSPNVVLMTVSVKGSESVVTNFKGLVDGEAEQGLKTDCSGTASTTVSVTVVGTRSL